MLMKSTPLGYAIEIGLSRAEKYYRGKHQYSNEQKHFKRVQKKDFKETQVDQIRSSGYVVDTLEARICLRPWLHPRLL
jgi:ADP-ribosylglycohydrolase